jgi:hypothetical protein
MNFTSKNAFLSFMTKSGYERLDQNKVYRADSEKVAIYSWNDVTCTVDQMVMPPQTIKQLSHAIKI